MIWIIGGTSEARIILDRIRDLGASNNCIVSVATPEGRKFLDAHNITVGRMDLEEMILFIEKHNISLIADLSHPYAKVVSKNAREAAKSAGIPYHRYERDKTHKYENVIYLSDYEECYNYIQDIRGTVFFTTGSKNIADFEKVRGDNRFIYRILPALESIRICVESGIEMKDMVAALGPFSKEFNKAMLCEYKADYCVMKDSGSPGGTPEKIEACLELSIKPVVIGRAEEGGLGDLEEVLDMIRRH